MRAGLVLVAASMLVPAAGARADTSPALGGYQGSAAAAVLQVRYMPENFLPIAAPLDLGVPDALVTVNTGPTTYARASVADPGDLLANPDALIAMALEDDWESGTLPPYPFRVEATSGFGEPRASADPAPGLRASVEVADGRAEAQSTLPSVAAPPILDLGTATSQAWTRVDDSMVEVRARSQLQGLDLLGIVRLDSVVSDVTARSDGTTIDLDGETTFTGLTILGQRATLGADGLELADGGSDPGPLGPLLDTLGLGDLGATSGPLGGVTSPGETGQGPASTSDPAGAGDVLEALGIGLTVLEPVEQRSDGTGELRAAGLRIDLELSERTIPLLGEVAGLLSELDAFVPDIGLGDVSGALGIRHVVTIEIGGASASLSAQPGFTVDIPPFEPPADDASAAPPPSAAPRSPTGPAPGTVPAEVAAPPSAGSVTEELGAPVLAQGVGYEPGLGIGLAALLVLAAQPLLGGRLARGASTLLAPQTQTACPREGR